MFDVIIIGGGPAALAAAVYLARQKLHLLILAANIGGQTLLSTDVENYLGFHLLNGQELAKRFREHLADYQDMITIKEGEIVAKAEKIENGFRCTTEQGMYEGKTLLVASGTKHRVLNVPGEQELYGKGVTYCATCDAPLFRDKVVYVIGGGNSAMDAALFAEKYAARVVVVTTNAELSGDNVMKAKVSASAKIKVYPMTKTTKIVGEQSVAGIGLVGPDGAERVEPCEGVFVEIGVMSAADFIDFVAKDKWGQIIVDKSNATNVEGVWAAGDVTDIAEKQIAVAVGEGSKASLSIIKYFQTHPV